MKIVLAAIGIFSIGWVAPALAWVQSAPTAESRRIDARSEVAAALYAASATQAAYQKVEDTELRRLRGRVASLETSAASSKAALTAARDAFVAAVSARDRAYGQEIAVFRGAVEDIAATPEGEAALRRFNAGDEVGALSVLDQLQAARERARRARADIETAAEKRHIGALAFDAYRRGKVAVKEVIARYEDVVRLDPGVAADWARLSGFYEAAGRTADALSALQTAFDRSPDEAERGRLLDRRGSLQQVQGDYPGAAASFKASVDLFRRRATKDPSSTEDRSETAFVLIDLAVMQYFFQDDPSGAKSSSEEALGIGRSLLAADPRSEDAASSVGLALQIQGFVKESAGDLKGAMASFREEVNVNRQAVKAHPDSINAQGELSEGLQCVGMLQMREKDFDGALATFTEEVGISGRLAAADPSSAAAQRSYGADLDRMAEVQKARGDLGASRASYEASLAIMRRLAAGDPLSAAAKGDLAMVLQWLGAVQVAQRDYAGASASDRESIELWRQLAASTKSPSDATRAVALMTDLGDVQTSRGAANDARASYREALDYGRRKLETAPGSQDLWDETGEALSKLALSGGASWSEVVAHYEEMRQRGLLSPEDSHLLDEARAKAAPGP